MIALAFPLWMQDKMPIIITCHWNLSPHIDRVDPSTLLGHNACDPLG